MRKQGNEDAWKFVLMTDVGKEHMDAIRDQATKLIASTASKMELAQLQVKRSLQLSRIGIAAVAWPALLAFYLYLRQTNALKLAGRPPAGLLQQERDLLEAQVRERTATLAELATHLQQVREQERGHLARELHDELGALLTAAKLDVARLKSKLGSSSDVTQRLQHLTETLNSGIALKRRIIEDLRPSSLANLGLVASLEILAREFSERSGMEVETAWSRCGTGRGDAAHVYRLVQESLTNIGKYAQAKMVDISLRRYENHIEVEIKDDGQGFDPRFDAPVHPRPGGHAPPRGGRGRPPDGDPQTHRRPADEQAALLSVTCGSGAGGPRRYQLEGPGPKEIHMLHYAVVFLVIALIAAVFGFGGIAAGAVEIAKILFFIFAIMAIVSFVVSLIRKG
jgi:signal transduction histidine kinase/uncharacterized membrane protein YtjA (UPF0391 family)